MNKDNIIPPMTHPYGMCWQQPPTYLILIDDTHAVMSRLDFEILMDYTRSQPSALYNGKMWKAQYEDEGTLKWFLCYCFNDRPFQDVLDCYTPLNDSVEEFTQRLKGMGYDGPFEYREEEI